MNTGIYEAMPRVAASIGAVSKNRKNVQQGYAFRGVDDFMNAAHPALIEHGVTVLPEVIDRWMEVRDRSGQGGKQGVTVHTVITVRYTFFAADGSSVSAVTVGEAADTADKASNKALSAAYKYALMQTFCIPLEDMVDGDSETPDMGARQSALVRPAAPTVDRQDPRAVALVVRAKALSESQQAELRDWFKAQDATWPMPLPLFAHYEETLTEIEKRHA